MDKDWDKDLNLVGKESHKEEKEKEKDLNLVGKEKVLSSVDFQFEKLNLVEKEKVSNLWAFESQWPFLFG